ncbi:flippase [Pontibacter sp. H249]|uniref:flippase n=1 Tax=Pontibacter sp. H249 TaxID=3133420 RepID=UPI0030C3265D
MNTKAKVQNFINKISNEESKTLIANFFSLGFIQGTNFLLSILTFPYIIRTVGVENFGIVTFFQALMFYFTVLTDYGFNLSATKEVSTHRGNLLKVSAIFSEVLATKTILFVASLFAIFAFFFFLPEYRIYITLTLFSLTIVLGQLIIPTWFFQGIEKMKYITYINIINRALYAILIFLYIKQKDDYIYINLINGVSSIVGGILILGIAFKKFQIKVHLPSLEQIKQQLEEGWNIFFSNVTVTIANNTNILILGFYANPLVLGYYSIAEKIFIIFRSFAIILHQVIYPRVCFLAQESTSMLTHFLRKTTAVIIAAFLSLSIVTFFLSDYIIYLVSGQYIDEASLILRIIAIGPLMAALAVPASQVMLANQLSKDYAVILSIGAVLNVSLNFILAYYFKAVGTAICILVTETVVVCTLYYVLYKYHPKYIFFNRKAIAKQSDYLEFE